MNYKNLKYLLRIIVGDNIRSHLDSANRAKRTVELQYEEAASRINELTTVNVNLVSIKSKLEQELSVVASDYEEVSKELRISDERYQKVSVELKHVVEQVHEEQERIVKLETIKKSLEVEVKVGVCVFLGISQGKISRDYRYYQYFSYQ